MRAVSKNNTTSNRPFADVLVKVTVSKSVGLVAASDQRYCVFESFVEHLRDHKDCLPWCAVCVRV